jgi:hypothetical protein
MVLRPRPLLTLEFDVNAGPLSGRLRGGGSDGEWFAGWMGLTRTIELALAAARCDEDAALPAREA